MQSLVARAVLMALAILATTPLLSTAAPSPRQAGAFPPHTIVARDAMTFEPAEVLVVPGQEVVVINGGTLPHDLTIEAWGIATGELAPGATARFTVPMDATPGSEVAFRCTAPGHTEAGQTGTFTVTAPDGTRVSTPTGDEANAGQSVAGALGASVGAAMRGSQGLGPDSRAHRGIRTGGVRPYGPTLPGDPSLRSG